MGLKSAGVGLLDFHLGITSLPLFRGSVAMNGKVEEDSNRWSNCIRSHFYHLTRDITGYDQFQQLSDSPLGLGE